VSAPVKKEKGAGEGLESREEERPASGKPKNVSPSITGLKKRRKREI